MLAVFVVTGIGDVPLADVTGGMFANQVAPDTYQLPSLRAAMEAANTNPGLNTIDFDTSSGPAPFVITPSTPLPPIINNPVIIDGYSQYSQGATWNTSATSDTANLLIEINGSQAGPGANGLEISAGGCVVQGLVINGFGGNGIQIDTAGGNTIAGNFIGTDITGANAVPNANGIALESGANDNLIGSSAQTSFTDDSGNTTGINSSVATDTGLSNAGSVGTRNVISGNTGSYLGGGVCIYSNNNVVAGNFIGTNVAGTDGIGNSTAGGPSNGVLIDNAGYNLIGGTDPNSRNIISGNNSSLSVTVYAADVRFYGAYDNTVAGNYIGTDVTGTKAISGTQAAIGVFVAYGTNTVNTIQRNVISGHTLTGVVFAEGIEAYNLVEDNLIGTNYNGICAIPQEYGVGIIADAFSNRIVGNTIAYNITAGITSIYAPPGDAFPLNTSSSGNTFQQNSIYDNGVLGIDLGGLYNLGTTQYTSGGVTQPSQFGTPGPNDFQAYPTITSAQFDQTTGTTQVDGTLSNCDPNATYTLDFYANTTAYPSGYGQGQYPLGVITIPVGSPATASFDGFLNGVTGTNEYITATATKNKAGDSSDGDTSEFSLAQQVNTPAPTQGANPDATTTTVTAPNSSDFGTSVTLMATVVPVAPGTGTPTGTVDFMDTTNGTDLGAAFLNNGIATLSTSFLAVGTDTIAATYFGDANFQATFPAIGSTPASTSISTSIQVFNPTTTNVTLQEALTEIDAQNAVKAVNEIPPQSPAIIVTLTLAPGTYEDLNCAPKAGVTLDVNGTVVNGGDAVTIYGGSPALTVSGLGDVVVQNVILTTATGSPTVLVSGGNLTLTSDDLQSTGTAQMVISETGGSLTLRDDTVQSTGAAQTDINVSGGAVDLGTPTDPGGNTLSASAGSAASLIQTTGAAAVASYGNTSKAAGSPVPSLVAVLAATPVVVATDAGGTYNTSAYPATATVAGVGAQSTPSATLESVGTTFTYYVGTGTSGTDLGSAAPIGYGTYTVVANFAGSTDYTSANSAPVTFTIGKATPVVVATDAGGTYNTSAYPATATVAGVGAQSTPSATLETVGTRFTYYAGNDTSDTPSQLAALTPLSGTPIAAGTYTVVASFAGSTDYLSANSAPVTFTINKATVNYTINNDSQIYGTPANFATDLGTTIPGVNGETLDIAYSSTGDTPTADVGTYLITGVASNGTGLLSNYTVTLNPGTLTVTTVAGSIYVLDPKAGGALSLSGNAGIDTSGNVVVDSNSTGAILASGNATVTAASVQVVGGVGKSGNAKVAKTGAPGATGNPLAGLVAPTVPTYTGTPVSESVSGNSTATISQGLYSQINVSGNAKLTLNPGVYVIGAGGVTVSGNASLSGSGVTYIIEGGGFTVSGNANLSGTNVLIYNTTSGSTSGSISLSGNGTLSLSAAGSGPDAGVLIFQPSANVRALSFSGNSMAGLAGTVYAPSAQLVLSGNGKLNDTLVVDMVSISGNAIAQLVAANGGTVYTPAQIRTAYGINDLSLDGTGQTIAIVDAYDDPQIYQALDTFDSQFGLTNSGPTLYQQYGPATSFLSVLNQNGQATSLPGTDPVGPGNDNWEVETALDVEWAHAIAPGAQIVLVEANSQSLADLVSAADTAAKQPGVSVVSMSWGFAEGQGVLAADEATYDKTLTAPGVTFVASTGDYGAADPVYPAFSPNVLAVGGTSLSLNADNSYASESGWGYYSSAMGMSIGSGGGISQYEPEPAYQQRVQSTGSRTTPDVSFVADPATGAWVADPYNLDPSNPWEVVGGTSLSAPCWAGLIALVNQGRSAAGQPALNHASPTETQQSVYGLSQSDFHVITNGSNGYSAAAGYNLVTGLGTPVANLLVSDLIAGNFPATGQVPPGSPSALVNSAAAGGNAGGTANVMNVFTALTMTGPTDSSPARQDALARATSERTSKAHDTVMQRHDLATSRNELALLWDWAEFQEQRHSSGAPAGFASAVDKVFELS